MKRYILGASPTKQTAMIRSFDENGTIGDWQEFNAGIVYLASDVEEVLRKIMAEADGCGEHNSKEFHRECLNSVRTIAHLALENRTL